MRVHPAHIAGVGISDNSDAPLEQLAITAGAKALLDAGVTYSDIDLSVASFLSDDTRIPRSSFAAFGAGGAPVVEVDNASALFTAVQSVRAGDVNCALVIGIDMKAATGTKSQPVAVGTVLVSHLFLTSHAYLKDAAVCILSYTLVQRPHSQLKGRQVDPTQTALRGALRGVQIEPKDIQLVQAQQSSSNHSGAQSALRDVSIPQPRTTSSQASTEGLFSGTTGFAGICELVKVYQLRGWAHSRAIPDIQHALQFTQTTSQSSFDDATSTAILLTARSDGRKSLAWKAVCDMRDGRERLGYNPAVETRGIMLEDVAAVRAREHEGDLGKVVEGLRLDRRGGDRASLARL